MQKIIVIVGPTASGKSDFAVRLAKKIDGEIISADSRQIYRGLNIGSGKITKKEMRGVPHYCLSIASPKKIFTADDFKKCGERAIATILKKNKTPIIVGGTGFYIDVLLGRMQTSSVPPNAKLRKSLEKKSAQELFTMLKKLDPIGAKTIDQHNPRRLVRAIEIARSRETTSLAHHPFPLRGLPLGKGEQSEKTWEGKVLWLGIKRSPDELKKRIHTRLIKRLPGIIREIRNLHHRGVSWKRLYDFGLEYRYGALYLQKKLNKKDFEQQLETAIWHYARRQATWWRKNTDIHWIEKQPINKIDFLLK